MSDKQDRVAPRTATDLERKYQFGKTFSEMLGLISDARDKVDEVESGLTNEITKMSTSLKRSEESIEAHAEQLTQVYENIGKVDESVSEVKKSVDAKMDASQISFVIKEEMLTNGVSVEMGYSFTKDGLNIEKSGEEMSNKLDHTGMYVKRSGDEILTANNKGVVAKDLHAKTYLIIGSGDGRSRFEDYGIDRVGCFWMGG
jgi:hypothetical protein